MGSQSIFSSGGHGKLANQTGNGAGTLKLPISKDTADGAVLHTVPKGQRIRVARSYWENTTGWTGGASSKIGISSSNPSYNTAGDLLGGAAGDAAAALVAGFQGGTLGTKFGSNGVIVLGEGDQILFNRMTSQFAAGAGFACFEVISIDNNSDT
jgi:hypothetical protein